MLDRLAPLERIPAIEAELKKVQENPTEMATWHRKKLLRMHDDARLEAGLVTRAQLQRENSPVADRDRSKSEIIWPAAWRVG